MDASMDIGPRRGLGLRPEPVRSLGRPFWFDPSPVALDFVTEPITDLATGALVACEVLARPWDGQSFSRWALGAPVSAREVWNLAVAAARPSLQAGLSTHVNVGAYLLSEPGFAHALLQRLTPDEGSRLVIEVTEVEPILGSRQLDRNLAELRRGGVTIALDDFGEGYANFRALTVLHPEIVKITRRTAESHHDGIDVAAWFVRTCRKLDVKNTVIECIESPSQHDWAREAGFQLGQGYLWSDLPTPSTGVGPSR